MAEDRPPKADENNSEGDILRVPEFPLLEFGDMPGVPLGPGELDFRECPGSRIVSDVNA